MNPPPAPPLAAQKLKEYSRWELAAQAQARLVKLGYA
jgi:hypothetical protein